MITERRKVASKKFGESNEADVAVYTLSSSTMEWVPLADGNWIDLRLLKDDHNNSYRLVAFSPSQDIPEVILNSGIQEDSEWILVSEDFAEFQCPKEPRYGLYFLNHDAAIKFSDAMFAAIQALQKLRIPIEESILNKSNNDPSNLIPKISNTSDENPVENHSLSSIIPSVNLIQAQPLPDIINNNPSDLLKRNIKAGHPLSRVSSIGVASNSRDSLSPTPYRSSISSTTSVRGRSLGLFEEVNAAVARTVDSNVDFHQSVNMELEGMMVRDANSRPSSLRLSGSGFKPISDKDRNNEQRKIIEETMLKVVIDDELPFQNAKEGLGVEVDEEDNKFDEEDGYYDLQVLPDKPPPIPFHLLPTLPTPTTPAAISSNMTFLRGLAKSHSNYSFQHAMENEDDDDDDEDDEEPEWKISQPVEVKHNLRVVFNEELARFEGLPDEWSCMNQQFGLDYNAAPKTLVNGYDFRIPAVLEMLRKQLVKNHGLETIGIFRLAPNKDECEVAKKQINSGTFEHCSDVNIIANLIKVYFREMPVGLFNVFPDSTIYKVAESPLALAVQELMKIEEPQKSLIFWLLDLMATVVQSEDKNRMSARNMAIVMSPNLYSISSENPCVALTMSQKVADFTTKLLAARLQTKWKYDAGVS